MRVFSDPLGWLLEPESPTSFEENCYGQRPWLCRSSDRERFSSLLSLDDVDEILGRYALPFPEIRVVRSDQDIPKTDYIWKNEVVDPMRAGRLFAEGATLIFDQLHDRHEPLRKLCAALSDQTGFRTQTNIYLTPPNAQGFPPHWDSHDVFVLQVTGTKRWKVYDQGVQLPLSHQTFTPEGSTGPGEVVAEFDLEPGDALYIPRGMMHDALSTDGVSMHITLGLLAYTWVELAAECLATLADDDTVMRGGLPLGFHKPERMQETVDGLQKRVKYAFAHVDVDEVLRSRVEEILAGFRPRQADHLRQALRATGVEPDDLVQRRELLVGTLEESEGRVRYRAGRREVEFPDIARETLEAIDRPEPVRAGGIEDGLDWESRKVVLSTLIREGIAVNLGRKTTGGAP